MEVVGTVPVAAARKTWLVEGKRSGVMVARALVEPTNCTIPLRVLNPRDQEVTLRKGLCVAELEDILPMDVAPVSEGNGSVSEKPTEDHQKRLWELVDQSERGLSQREKEQLFALLLDYQDLFATGPQDLGQTSRVQHKVLPHPFASRHAESLTFVVRRPGSYSMIC